MINESELRELLISAETQWVERKTSYCRIEIAETIVGSQWDTLARLLQPQTNQ